MSKKLSTSASLKSLTKSKGDLSKLSKLSARNNINLTKPVANLNYTKRCKRKLADGCSDLIENRNSKHKVLNKLNNYGKREISQPPTLDWNQVQGNLRNDSDDEKEPNDHGCLKASIWNKPEDDPRYVIRIGTSKIRSHSEEAKVKTIEDEEKEKKQFELYCKEVERRFRKSKLKDYSFPLKSQQIKTKQVYLKSRNQNEIEERFIKLTDLFELMKSQRTLSNLGVMASSLDSRTIEDTYTQTK